MKKAALHNLGCKVNSYEVEAMEQMLLNDGYEIVPFSEKADVYVINTCSVTNMADRKSRQMIHRAKKQNPDAIVIAAGCYVQTATIAGLKPEDFSCDIIIGNNKKHNLIEEIRKFEASRQTETDIIDINKGVAEYEEFSTFIPKEHTRAFIKIQDGCNQFCTYCIIPYARGRARSRDLDSILKEVKLWVEKGYKEIVLTGIHITSYGIPGKVELIDVIEAINAIEGVERIRLSSLEPQVCTDEFCRRISRVEKICPHFHLSLQSGCDETLKRMNRKYSATEYLEGCKRLRAYFENPAITTDVIVGFPQESDEEFQISKAFCREISFYEMHVFKYSKRHGTKAEKMSGQVLEKVKSARSDELLALEREMSKEYRSSFIGKEVSVLFEEKTEVDDKTYMTGFTKEYIKVAYLLKNEEHSLENQIRTGRISGFLKDDLMVFEI